MSPPAKSSVEDAEWMRRLAVGELAALEPLYERYRPMVLALVRQADLSLASSAAEDVCQEVFLALVDAARRFRPDGNVRAYIAGVAVRKAREHRRATWFRRNVMDRLPGLSSPPSRLEERTDAVREGERLLAALPAHLREVLVMHTVEGLEAADIAQALGININTVWTRLHRARAALAEARESS